MHHRRAAVRGWIGLLVLGLLVGCVGPSKEGGGSGDPSATASAVSNSGRGSVTVGRTAVRSADATQEFTISPRPLSDAEKSALAALAGLPLAAGLPADITSPAALPAEGVTITRTYAQPLAEGMVATLAFFDPDPGVWFAAQSSLSADRRSVSAVVHHLSLWTDLVSGAQSTIDSLRSGVTDAAEWAFWGVGKVFDERVDPPACDAGQPSWVKSTTFIKTDKVNPILFCVGQDQNNPNVLVVKARVNRGFGYRAVVNGDPSWTSNSTFDQKGLDQVLDTVAELDEAIASSVREVTAEGALVGPGEEFRLGVNEEQVRRLKDSLVLKLEPQPLKSYLLTYTAKAIVGAGIGLDDGLAIVSLATAKCIKDGKDQQADGDLASRIKSGLSCTDAILGSQDLVAKFLVKKSKAAPEKAGSIAKGYLGTISVYLALIGPAFNAINYVAESTLPESARSVAVYPVVIKGPLSGFEVFDAGAYTATDFTTPSGTWCGIDRSSGTVLCQFKYPIGSALGATLPPVAEVCPAWRESSLPSGVQIIGNEKMSYYCSGGAMAYPMQNSPTAKWNAAANFPVIDGAVSLPYGKALKNGDFACKSEKSGVTCLNLKTGNGFKLNSESVTRVG